MTDALKFKISVQELQEVTRDAIQFQEALTDIPSLEVFDNQAHGMNMITNAIVVLASAMPSADVRKEAQRSLEALESVQRELSNVFFKRLLSLGENLQNKSDEKLFSQMCRDFQRQGLYLLSDEEKKSFDGKEKHRKHTAMQLSEALNKAQPVIFFSSSELDGLSESFLSGLPLENGLFRVRLTNAVWSEISENATNENTRKIADMSGYAQNDACKELFHEFILSSREAARALGFSQILDRYTGFLMAGETPKIRQFLDDMLEICRPAAQSDIQKMMAFSLSGQLEIWNASFLRKKVQEKYLESFMSFEQLKEYFPLEKVFAGMLRVFGIFFSLSFVASGPFCADGVEIRDVSCYDKDTKTFLGKVTVDFFNRSGKEVGNWCLCVTPRVGGHPAEIYLCADFMQSDDGPVLLSFKQVETLFHEFGHCIHHLCSEVPADAFSTCEDDFIECPSQMLEWWVYQPEILEHIAEHCRNGGKLPGDEVTRLLNHKTSCSGYTTARMLAQARFDHVLHTSHRTDYDLMWAEAFEECLGIRWRSLSSGYLTFSHLWTGYGGRFYGYLYSQVMAASIFKKLTAVGSLLESGHLGKEYREEVLSRWGTRPSLESICLFLGKVPSVHDFKEINGW